jgi:hypothetical protein
MIFGNWLRDIHTDPKHPFEIDFREDTLGLSDDAVLADDLAEFFQQDFSDPSELIDWMRRTSKKRFGWSSSVPCLEALEGAMRCWVKWRECLWREQERELADALISVPSSCAPSWTGSPAGTGTPTPCPTRFYRGVADLAHTDAGDDDFDLSLLSAPAAVDGDGLVTAVLLWLASA